MATLVLRSNNLHDIQAAINLGGWTHTNLSRRAKRGDTLVVFGNKTVCSEAGVKFNKQLALIGRLTKDPYRLGKEDENYPSNKTGTSNRYLGRYDLESMDLVPLDVIPGVLHRVSNAVGHMNGGIYLV